MSTGSKAGALIKNCLGKWDIARADSLLSICIPSVRRSLLKGRHSSQAMAKTLPCLRELDFSYASITSKGVACLSSLCNLETLCLQYCYQVDDEGSLPRPIGQEQAAARTPLVA